MKKFTITAFVAAITAVFAVSATANEWSLYGSARVATFYTSQDLGKDLELVSPNTFVAVDARNIANQSTEKDLQWILQGNSRIGAKVEGDMVEGQFEFGVTSDGAAGNVFSRRLYATWKFADGWGLTVGKDYTPISFFLSDQVFDSDSNLQFLGEAYGARRGQLAVEGQLGPGMLKVALIDQTTDTLNTPDGVVEKVLPKFEASYEFKFSDAMSAHAFGGYQTYSVKYPAEFGGTNDFSVDSWLVGAGADLNFGPFFVKPQVSYYQNGAAAGWLNDNYLPFSTSGFVANINSVLGLALEETLQSILVAHLRHRLLTAIGRLNCSGNLLAELGQRAALGRNQGGIIRAAHRLADAGAIDCERRFLRSPVDAPAYHQPGVLSQPPVAANHI